MGRSENIYDLKVTNQKQINKLMHKEDNSVLGYTNLVGGKFN